MDKELSAIKAIEDKASYYTESLEFYQRKLDKERAEIANKYSDKPLNVRRVNQSY